MATRAYIAPARTRTAGPTDGTTLHLIGDTHSGPTGLAAWRQDALTRDANRLPAPAATIQLGDCTNDTPTPDTPHYTAFMGRLRTPRYSTMGNHDVYAQTPQQWATSLGYASPSYVVDLPGLRLIMFATCDQWVDYDFVTTDKLTWLGTQIAGTSNPVMICSHLPLYGTVRSGGGNDETSTASPFYLRTAANPGSSIDILNVLGAYTNVKAWLCAHTHSRIEAPGIVTAVEHNGRRFAVINASSPGYTTGSGPTAAGNTVATAYATWLGDRIEVRYRDHGAGTWASPNGNRVLSVGGLG